MMSCDAFSYGKEIFYVKNYKKMLLFPSFYVLTHVKKRITIYMCQYCWGKLRKYRGREVMKIELCC
jgi:hypothetical protein